MLSIFPRIKEYWIQPSLTQSEVCMDHNRVAWERRGEV